MRKKIAILHRYPKDQIRETNAAFPHILERAQWDEIKKASVPGGVGRIDPVDVLTFKKFNRLHNAHKIAKSIAWIFYAPLLVFGRGYSVIYCDDSFPFYAALVKLASPGSKVIKRMGDFHLMYYCTGPLYWFFHFFEWLEWEIVDKIFAISKVMQDKIVSEIRTWDKPKVYAILDPVDPNNFPICRKEDHGTVMFHGLLTRNKNVDVLLAAAERLPKILFVIVGDGPDRERLEDLAPSNVRFTGWVPFHKIVSILNTCSVGVALRSDNPGNDYVVTSPFLQYSILAKPCLVTRRRVYGDYPWQFTGVEDLVKGIKELMSRPEEGKKMREYVLKYHNAKEIGTQIYNILIGL
jgi:glycosyltransferase involved in cell wall biosynthesis